MINFERLIYMRQPFLRKVLTGILMRELSQRTSQFTDSVIRRMTRVANKYGAVNLSQGFPDFDPPEAITDRLAEVAGEGPHQYALTWGAKNFRDALAAKQEHFSGMKIDAESEIVVTCGSTEAMMAAMMSVVNPGDKVIIFSPFDANVLEDAFKTGAKALILCNPSNPCGKVFTKEELKIISELAIKYDTYVITDEVYEHIIYEPNKHTYISTLPGMRERTIICNSLSKTYSITGWRLGYVIANPQIADRVKKVHDFLTVGAAAPLMEAAVTGLKFGDDYYKELQNHYTHMKNLFCDGLKNLGLTFSEPQGAYYVLMDVSEFGVKDDVKFCEWMTQHVGVAAVPGSSFFREDIHSLVRFHFAKKDNTLNAALDNLSSLRKKCADAQNVIWR